MFPAFQLILAAAFARVSLCDEGPVVVCPAGAVRGWERLSRDGRVYQAWTKIPFAQPPVGQLRFKPPKPTKKWRGVLNATNELPICLHDNDVTATEDCLYLSVYRPKFIKTQMPVIFAMHGGNFIRLPAVTREQADYLMDEDLVMVEFQFRTNGFGFASLGDDIMPGNFGIKDGVMALRWVKSNIKSFGGDPNRVIIVGSSSGGMESQILMSSPATQDLVTSSFSHSGSIGFMAGLIDGGFLKNWTIESARIVGCNTDDHQATLICLQSANASLLTSAFDREIYLESMNVTVFGPVIEPATAEDAVITEDLSLRPSNKPWALSISKGEFIVFYNHWQDRDYEVRDYQVNLMPYLQRFIRTHGGSWRDDKTVREGAELLKRAYFSSNESLTNLTVFKLSLAKMYSDATYNYPAMYNMKHHRGPKWLYLFEYRGELSVSYDRRTRRTFPFNVPSHGDNEEYFYNDRSSKMYPTFPEQSAADYAVSKRLNKYLFNFASHGDPNPTGSTAWRQFGDGNIFRVTAQGDRMDDKKIYSQLEDMFELWSNVVGWRGTRPEQ